MRPKGMDPYREPGLINLSYYVELGQRHHYFRRCANGRLSLGSGRGPVGCRDRGRSARHGVTHARRQARPPHVRGKRHERAGHEYDGRSLSRAAHRRLGRHRGAQDVDLAHDAPRTRSHRGDRAHRRHFVHRWRRPQPRIFGWCRAFRRAWQEEHPRPAGLPEDADYATLRSGAIQ